MRISDWSSDVCSSDLVIVGLPLSLDGSDGPAAKKARREAGEIGRATGLPVELWDERLTTVTADRELMAMDLKADARRRMVDMVAASVMLQAWLDHRRLPAEVPPALATRPPSTGTRATPPAAVCTVDTSPPLTPPS